MVDAYNLLISHRKMYADVSRGAHCRVIRFEESTSGADARVFEPRREIMKIRNACAVGVVAAALGAGLGSARARGRYGHRRDATAGGASRAGPRGAAWSGLGAGVLALERPYARMGQRALYCGPARPPLRARSAGPRSTDAGFITRDTGPARRVSGRRCGATSALRRRPLVLHGDPLQSPCSPVSVEGCRWRASRRRTEISCSG